MNAETSKYEPPSVVDLGSLVEITAGSGTGRRDIAANDGNGKT